MKSLFLLLPLLFAVSCVFSQLKHQEQNDYYIESPGIHKDAKPYVQQFIDLSKGSVEWSDFKHVFIGFKDFPDNADTVGTCWTIPSIDSNFNIYWNREIWLGKTWWIMGSQLEREELIFHELGHCMLFRPHIEISNEKGFIGWIERMLFKIGIAEEKGYLKDGCAASYMHPKVVSQECIARHYHYYTDELFNYKESEEIIEEIVIEEKFYYKTL